MRKPSKKTATVHTKIVPSIFETEVTSTLVEELPILFRGAVIYTTLTRESVTTLTSTVFSTELTTVHPEPFPDLRGSGSSWQSDVIQTKPLLSMAKERKNASPSRPRSSFFQRRSVGSYPTPLSQRTSSNASPPKEFLRSAERVASVAAEIEETTHRTFVPKEEVRHFRPQSPRTSFTFAPPSPSPAPTTPSIVERSRSRGISKVPFRDPILLKKLDSRNRKLTLKKNFGFDLLEKEELDKLPKTAPPFRAPSTTTTPLTADSVTEDPTEAEEEEAVVTTVTEEQTSEAPVTTEETPGPRIEELLAQPEDNKTEIVQGPVYVPEEIDEDYPSDQPVTDDPIAVENLAPTEIQEVITTAPKHAPEPDQISPSSTVQLAVESSSSAVPDAPQPSTVKEVVEAVKEPLPYQVSVSVSSSTSVSSSSRKKRSVDSSIEDLLGSLFMGDSLESVKEDLEKKLKLELCTQATVTQTVTITHIAIQRCSADELDV
ncbi:unnamed protein product [Cyprideis torosa]|uniref:Uncharacterized protein n=1 Tax=Cyprideis torosa TaxID=163714 RepID=A0A7R8ZKF3_9CRUS|nr:unnamed protein product [Cyprideis torosa]CAG0889233.1 unnamed protein product [Cyprideis torosa]